MQLSQEGSALRLEEAFKIFNRVSYELESSYDQLQEQVAQLSEELSESRTARAQELAEKERLASRLSALMAELPGGVVVLDVEGRIIEANPRAVRLLDHPLLQNHWIELYGQLFTPVHGFSGEVETYGGLRLSVQFNCLAATQESIILLTDITESHLLNEANARKLRLAAVGKMAARLAHQIRTPLSSAVLYTSQLRQPGVDAETTRIIAGRVLQGLRRLEQLIEDTLRYIRGDTEENSLFAVEESAAEVQQTMQPHLDRAKAVLQVTLPPAQVWIHGNRLAFFNTLCNLIDNSLQAVPDGAIIDLDIACRSRLLAIRLSDNGPGIDNAIKGRIFDPFFSTRKWGNGLGLAVAAATIEALGGTIEIANNPGCIVSIMIPDEIDQAGKKTRIWSLGVEAQEAGSSNHG